jgi:nitronate monooxygenase
MPERTPSADRPAFPGRLPIVQAPMAGVQDSALAIAVSRAGGVGSLPCAMLSPERLEAELDAIQAADIAVYNLNFFCHEQPEADALCDRAWLHALAPYYRELGLEREANPAGPGRQPFSAQTLDIIRPFAPPIVSFHFGLPQRSWVEEIRSWGGQVWSSATTVEEGRWLRENGADAVIAQGIEAGGHRGMFLTEDLDSQCGTMELLHALRHELDLPILAAGGIGGPERVRRALDAGAWAVQVGTAYLCCVEAGTSRLHREMLLSARAGATELTNLFSGRPARGVRNRLMDELGPLCDQVPAFPLASAALAPLRAAAEARGRVDFTPLWCGTDASGCRRVSAAQQTHWLAGRTP